MKISNAQWREVLYNRLLNFGVMIIKLTNNLPKTAAGYAIASQIIRSATSVGANFTEAQDASSTKDFLQKITISLREARETEYWIKMIYMSELYPEERIKIHLSEVKEIIAILTSTVKSSKSKLI